MTTSRERILLVENDPETCDLIARQTLQPMGYRVEVVGAAAPAIQGAVRFAPDVILANLNLPGLSGKDLLVALSSQGLEVPIIVIANKGMESDVIQAFRLGASDYLSAPIRETEVVVAVERALKQVRSRREREMLAQQLKQTNQELQRRVRELTTIFAIGKAVTSITEQRMLLDKIVEGAVYVTEADAGWLLLKDEGNKSFLLRACQNLPKSIADKINQPWEDGISSLVALSGESLSIYGEPLKRFKVSMLGQSALVVPVKAKKEVIGLLVVVRKAPAPFGSSNQTLLEAVADYASISLVNARLFKVLEERARSLQQAAEGAQVSEHIKDEILTSVSRKLNAPLAALLEHVKGLLDEKEGKLTPEQKYSLSNIQQELQGIAGTVETVNGFEKAGTSHQKSMVDLNDLARSAAGRFQAIAQQQHVKLLSELSSKMLLVNVFPSQITRVFESLLSNAIKCSPAGGQALLRLELVPENNISWAHALVKDSSSGMDKNQVAKVFEDPSGASSRQGFGGLGLSLALVKEIITAHNGKMWVESEAGKGTTFHFSLPAINQ